MEITRKLCNGVSNVTHVAVVSAIVHVFSFSPGEGQELRSHILSSVPKASEAQCNMAHKSDELTLYTIAVFGPQCVQIFQRSVTVCSDSEESLIQTELQLVESVNVQGIGASTKSISDDCARAEIATRPADHAGNYPSYRCSPLRYRASLHISYCVN